MKDGIAQLYAFKFNENLDLVEKVNLNSQKVRTMGVTCMKRVENLDLLYVGTNKALFVVEWTGSHFEILNKVENIHSCKI